MGTGNEAKVRPGEEMRIDSTTWNDLIDMLRWYKRSLGDLGGKNWSQFTHPTLTCLISNETGEDFTDCYRIVRLQDMAYEPDERTKFAFGKRPVVNGYIPSSNLDHIAIVQQPISGGAGAFEDSGGSGGPVVSKIATAVFRGMSLVRLKLNDTADQWAVSVAGQTGYMESATAGIAKIIDVMPDPFVSGEGPDYGDSGEVLVLALVDLVNNLGGDGGGDGTLCSLNGLGWTVGGGLGQTYHMTTCRRGGACDCGEAEIDRIEADSTRVAGFQDLNPITICGVVYDRIEFSGIGGSNAQFPYLKLTRASDQVVFDGHLDTWGNGFVVFAFGGPHFCKGQRAGDCADNVYRIKIECICTAIEGWSGAGWYCVRDKVTSGESGLSGEEESGEAMAMDTEGASGPPGACHAVELLNTDRCISSIEICAGPFATKFEAQTECEYINNECSPSIGVRRRLWAQVTNVSGCGTCAPTAFIEMIWNSQPGVWPDMWFGSYIINCENAGAPVNGTMILRCNAGTWSLENSTGCFAGAPSGVITVVSAEPLVLELDTPGDLLCCHPATGGTLRIRIAENISDL